MFPTPSSPPPSPDLNSAHDGLHPPSCAAPVTPEIRRDTYRQASSRPRHDYFTRRPGGHAPLTGAVISATFTIPQTLRYDGQGGWEIERPVHRSALFDAFEYLSSPASPWRHTVVGWTGEIVQTARSRPPSPPDSAAPDTSSPPPLDDGEPGEEPLSMPRADMARLRDLLWRDRLRTVPVWLADDDDDDDASEASSVRLGDQSRWRAFGDCHICPLFHYQQHAPTAGRLEERRWRDYRRLNEAFADAVCAAHRPGDAVVVHDYHLMLLPALLRRRRPDMDVAFYLAAPFPSSEFVRCLHRREELLDGLLGADAVGLQAFPYAQHLANSCARILGLRATAEGVAAPRGCWVPIAVLPEGIDVAAVTALAFAPSVDAKCAELRRLYGGRSLIVGYDPPGSLAGVDKKLQAVARLLDRRPEWKQRAALVQVNNRPAVDDGGGGGGGDGDERKYAARVNGLVHAVNRAYGSLGFTPVSLHSHPLSRDEYFALLRLGDAFLVTSAREGMSATGLEYVACQRDAHGLLIISEFSGTASNLEEALHVNPWDVAQVADQINNALTMPPERRREVHRALYRRVEQGGVQFWVDSILRRLAEAVQARDQAAPDST